MLLEDTIKVELQYVIGSCMTIVPLKITRVAVYMLTIFSFACHVAAELPKTKANIFL